MNTLNPAIRSLLLCDVLMLVAQMVGYIAVPWWIAREGGASDLATYGFVLAISALVTLPLLAPLGERQAKSTQIAGGLALLTVAALLLAIHAHSAHYAFLPLLLIGVLFVLADSVVTPASSAITAELVDPTDLPLALRRRKAAQSVGRLLGPVVAGFVLAVADIASALWLQFALLSVATVFSLRLTSAEVPNPRPVNSGAQWWSDVKAGAKAKWTVPIERGWTAVNFGVWIFVGPCIGILVPLKVQSLQLSASWLGACEAALSAGLLAGSLVGLPLLVRTFGRLHVRVGAAVAEGLALAFAGYVDASALLVLAYFCAGFANSSFVLVGATHRALAVPQDFRVRMTAVSMVTTKIAGSVGMALAGTGLAHWPVGSVYTAFGLVASVVAISFLWIPRATEFFALDHVNVTDWYRVQYPAAFGLPSSENHRR